MTEKDPTNAWSHSYWPKEQHEYLLDLVKRDHDGVVPAWARAVDLAFLNDEAAFRGVRAPGRRVLEERWGTGERATKQSIAATGWRTKLVDTGVSMSASQNVPVDVPRVSPWASPTGTDEPEQSPENVPVGVPRVSPWASPTRARSSVGPNGPTEEQERVPAEPAPSPSKTKKAKAKREPNVYTELWAETFRDLSGGEAYPWAKSFHRCVAMVATLKADPDKDRVKADMRAFLLRDTGNRSTFEAWATEARDRKIRSMVQRTTAEPPPLVRAANAAAEEAHLEAAREAYFLKKRGLT